MENLGARIQEAREAKGYSWEELAVATGLTVDEIQNVEQAINVDHGHVQRIASALQIELTACDGSDH